MENEEVVPEFDQPEEVVEHDEPEQPEADPIDPALPGEGDDEDEPQLTRAQQRHQKLANERAEAKARAEAAERERDFYRQQAMQLQQQRQAPQEDAYVSPEEKWQRDTQAQINQVMFQTADMRDQADYALKAAANPVYVKYQAKVEAELAKARAAGHNPPRESVLDILIGRDVRMNNGKPTPTQRKAAANVANARGTPPSAKPTVAPGRSGKGESLEELERRLTGVRL